MNKVSKIILNLAIFLVIIGFAWYMVASINNDHLPGSGIFKGTSEAFESHHKQIASFKIPDEINRFDLCDNRLFIASGQSVYIFDTEGKQLGSFPVGTDVRDITIADEDIYILYPTRIVVFSMNGDSIRQWEACSELSDYCSFTVAGDAVFVTDAENKDICKYTIEGDFVKFIKSPRGFIIPSYSFDIDSWNDTVYCVNSGRHMIETYTLDGDFITAFGAPGSEAGFFAGCCNPVYISFAPCGAFITSEKGNPRVSVFWRNGKFKGVWLNSKMLGGGNKACEVRAMDDKLFVAVKNKIIVFQCDKASNTVCLKGCAGCPYRFVNH